MTRYWHEQTNTPSAIQSKVIFSYLIDCGISLNKVPLTPSLETMSIVACEL